MNKYTRLFYFLVLLITIHQFSVKPTSMQKIKAIDNYFLPAADMNASRHFYGEILGLDVKFDFADKGLLAFKVGDDEPAIILKDTTHFPDAQPSLLLEVEDVKKTYQQLQGQGVIFTKAPYPIKTGWAAELKDPAGNIIGITDYKAQ
jgi:predicted enzyme related to lactoylglutathione lyase